MWSCIWGAKYSSRHFYAFYFKDVTADEVFRWIWKSKCTMKIKVFAWLLAADRVNTKNMLKRRHWNVADGVNCVLCNDAVEETVEHLFFDCPFSTSCWDTIDMHWGDTSNRLTKIHEGRGSWTCPMFMEIFLTAARVIWKERNDKVFRRIPNPLPSWKRRLKTDLAFLAHRVKPSLVEFVENFVHSIV